VLVCPECQRTHDWMAELDACARCGSALLVRTLGETQCRNCGATAETVIGAAAAGATSAAAPCAGESRAEDSRTGESGRIPGLSEDVAAALDRLFRRGVGIDG